MRPKIPSFLLFLSTLIFALVSAAPAKPKHGGEVVVLVGTGPPTAFISAATSGYSTGMVSTQLFASPLRYDENWQPKPYLAKSRQMSCSRHKVKRKGSEP